MEVRNNPGIKMVVFGWENVLLGQKEINDNNTDIPQLTFRQPIKDIFALLQALGIRIYVISESMKTFEMLEYLNQNDISIPGDQVMHIYEFESTSTNTFSGDYSATESVKLHKWRNLAKKYDCKNDEICFVDSKENCDYVSKQMHGIMCIPVTDVESIYINNPNHLYEVLDVCLHSHINKAIYDYKTQHIPSLLSYLFCDANRGDKRAEKYLALYNDMDNTPFSRLVILFALFASHDGEMIQKFVYQTLKLNDLKTAEEWFRLQIHLCLSYTGKSKQEQAKILEFLRDRIVGQIVKIANFEYQNMTREIIQDLLSAIEHRTGILANQQLTSTGSFATR